MAPVKWKGLDSQKNNQEEKGMQREYIGQMAELTGQEIRDITHGPRVICLFSAISCVCVGYSISSCVPAGGEGREGKTAKYNNPRGRVEGDRDGREGGWKRTPSALQIARTRDGTRVCTIHLFFFPCCGIQIHFWLLPRA